MMMMMMMMRCIFWEVSGKGGGGGHPDPAFSLSFFTTNVCQILVNSHCLILNSQFPF